MAPTTTRGSAIRHLPALDGLRGVALLGVLAFHLKPHLVTGGGFGVDLFFVLSGWLISSILLRELDRAGRIDIGAFFDRRARRLLPALAMLLVVYAAVGPKLSPSPLTTLIDVAAAALAVTNVREAFWPTGGALSHLWSLAVEWQFYLLWPFALTALWACGRGAAAGVLCLAWAVLTVPRPLWQAAGLPGAYSLAPFHMTGLLLGAALALHPIRVNWGGPALALLIAVMAFGQARSTWLVTLPLVEVLAVLVVAAPPKVLALPGLRWIGRISYGAYLWHMPLATLLMPRTPLGLLGLALLSLAAGWLSYRIVERPFLRRKQDGDAAAPSQATSAAKG